MIQFLLMLFGFVLPNHNINTINNDTTSITLQDNTNLGEGLDTGGETGPVLPPKK